MSCYIYYIFIKSNKILLFIKVYFLVLLFFFYILRKVFTIFKFLNFTNFIKNGEKFYSSCNNCQQTPTLPNFPTENLKMF